MAGRAELSLREWSGRARGKGVTQREFARLGAGDGVGIEMVKGKQIYLFNRCLHIKQAGWNHLTSVFNVAKHDGLSTADFDAWFEKPVFPMAVLHFTGFRYVG